VTAAESHATSGPAEAFIAELKHWRDVRGLSQSALAKRVGYTPSYISKIEHGQQRPSTVFAEQADTILRAGGALRRAYHQYEKQLRKEAPARQHRTAIQMPKRGGDGEPASLIVEHDDAELHYDGRFYRPIQRRKLRNAGNDPITRYLIRISVDRYPGNPERSNHLYREHPLTWEALNLQAWHGKEPMRWKVQHDRDAFKEVWLLFENDYGRFPLYPGESTWIEYTYTVGDDKWGTWFQRAVRLPTKRLSVRLVFPAELDPIAWGMETTMTAEALPFHTAISQHDEDDHRVFSWATEDPPLHARYRLEWKFCAQHDEEPMATTASEAMRSLGIVQEGDPILNQPTRPFALPEEAEDARRVIAELQSVMERVLTVHTFAKGVGIAAPQIGIDRAAAIVRTSNGETVTLLNPRVIDESLQSDEQYEGCLSFFDVRGMVPRPLTLEVEHQGIDGGRRITVFQRGVARLVAHEIDHLNGILYRQRMRPGIEPIPVTEYEGIGQGWTYG
jgi:peptide deformylase